MAERVFMTVLDLTVKGSLVILAVLLLRLLLARAPKWIPCALWLVALIRLLSPLELPTPVSLLPELQPVSQSYQLEDTELSFAQVGAMAVESVQDVVSGGTGVQNIPVTVPDSVGETQQITADPGDLWILFGSYLWAGGFAIMAIYSLVSILRLKLQLREAVLLEKGVCGTDRISSPFVLGLFRPRIYLPLGLEDREKACILAHERQHIRHLDPIWKALGFLALSLHWFNPLVWVAFFLGCRDIEMRCDEAVLKQLGGSVRGDYAATLLRIAAGRRITAGGPLAFGEGDPKGRIRNLARWKKPVLWITVVAVVLCVAFAVCLLTDPLKENTPGTGRKWYFGRLEQSEQGFLTLGWDGGESMEFIDALEDTRLPENGTWVRVRAVWNKALGAYEARKLETAEDETYADLDRAAEAAVLLFGGGALEEGQFPCASFALVARGPAVAEGGKGRLSQSVTLYGMGLHQLYENRNGVLQDVSGSHIPVALTFRLREDGGYSLVRYWMPRDGSYYANDLRSEFPGLMIPDTQKYIDTQRQECLKKAMAHFGEEPPEASTVPPTTEAIPTFSGPVMGKIPMDYGLEEALTDGVAVMINGNAYQNAEIWEEFFLQAESGHPAVVRIMEMGNQTQNYLEELRYDGEMFHLQTQRYYNGRPGGTVLRFSYPTLHCYEGAYYTCYGLSWQDGNWDSEPGWSQRDGSGNPVMVFQYKEEVPENPVLPEKLISASLMLEETAFGQITDPNRVQSLETMLREAEFIPRATGEYFYPELHLLLEFADGTRLVVPVMPESDSMLVGQLVYDYGPGMVPYEDGQRNCNAILEMVRHFGLEDWPEALNQWFMDRGKEPLRHSLKVIVGEEPHP